MGAESTAPVVYLLDTATLLWVFAEPDRLSRDARAIWTNPRALIAVSVVSYWEIAIKAAKGILKSDDVGEWWQRRALLYVDMKPVHVREEHVTELLLLPQLHKDPFDRMLIAQARVENMPLVTPDKLIRTYDVRTIW